MPTDNRRIEKSYRLLIPFGAGLLMGGFSVWWFLHDAPPPAWEMPADVAVPGQVATPPAPRLEEAEPDNPEAVAPPSPPRQQAAVATNPQEELRERLRAQMNVEYPPQGLGDRVELRRADGRVYRGELISLRDGMATVVAGDLTERVPLTDLDVPSRLRADPAFRAQRLEWQLQRSEERNGN
jgi:hypothetical protein